ncbi:TRAP transporter large permease [Thermodesulfobacteriota bacterium]
MEIAPITVGILGFVLLFILILLRVPIAFAFGAIGFSGLIYLRGLKPAVSVLTTNIWTEATSYTLMAVPLFILMGMFAYQSGIGPDLYQTALRWVGRVPGGLAVATTWGCAAFAACTGSSTAGVLTFGPIAFKPMLENKYSRSLSLGTICCGATMGQVIPPSLGFIIYGGLTDESVGKLFMAGIVPGLLEAVLYSIVIIAFTALGIWSGPPGPKFNWKEKFASLKDVWGMLTLFLLVMGGIYGGIFTPTEAAALGAFGSLVILVSRRGFSWTYIKNAFSESLRTSCMVLTIIIGAIIFARFVANTGLSDGLANGILALPVSPTTIVVLLLFVYFLVGCLMPGVAFLTLTVPLLYPAFVTSLGLNGLWFGVLAVVSLEVAQITPPIGMNLFAIKGLLKDECPEGELYRGVLPFVLADLVRIALLVAFPALSLWLPSQMVTR